MSPTTILAILALVVSMSGTAWAVTKINGSQLVNRSVSHTKLKAHTLTGAEINKPLLGLVPAAKRAGDASALGGLPASDFTQNVWATETSKPLTLNSTKDFTTVLKQPFVNDSKGKAGFLNFTDVEATNPSKTSSATLTLGLMIDGQMEDGSYSDTIAPGSAQSVFSVLKCNGMPPGTHTIAVAARTDGTLDLGTRADDGLRPIVVPPGGHSSFTGEG